MHLYCSKIVSFRTSFSFTSQFEDIMAHKPVAKQWLSKRRPLLGNARNIHACNTRGIVGYYFLYGPCKMVVKKSSVENLQSSPGFPREQLVESWALQGKPRWRYEFRCGVLTSGQRRDHGSNLHCVKSVARK
jgi:hypothetical protein